MSGPIVREARHKPLTALSIGEFSVSAGASLFAISSHREKSQFVVLTSEEAREIADVIRGWLATQPEAP